MIELRDLWKDLSEDASFFVNYKDRFRENFLRFVDEEKSKLISLPGINTLIDRLYLLLFSFRKDPTQELFSISYTLAKNEIDLKKVIEKSFLALLKDYIDHTISERGDHKKVKSLIDLIDTYISTIEDAHLKYVEELRQEVKEKGAAIEESERRIALEFLQKIKEKDEIGLLVYYKGIPIACSSRILGVVDELVRTSICEVNIFDPGTEIYIKHPNLPKPIAAEVRERDLNKKEVLLEVIGFKDLPQERRKYLRVLPQDTVKINLSRGGWSTEGTMADISVGGIGVYVEDRDDLKEGDVVEVSFTLPKGKIETEASVRYVLPHEKIYRIGLQYNLDIPKEEIVSDYVMERQFEILRELKGLRR